MTQERGSATNGPTISPVLSERGLGDFCELVMEGHVSVD
jgi:hypothetical protein